MSNQLRGQALQLSTAMAIGIMAMASLALPGVAAQPADIQQLMQSGACPGCDLAGADLSDTHLIGADLREANLQGANLAGANLEGADLTGADLRGAQMTKTYLTNASLNRSNLANANLTGAIAFYADTRGANLSNLTIAGAQIFGSGISIGGDEALPGDELGQPPIFIPGGLIIIPVPPASSK
jgi:uncharacterized protein YjbI with pentapeptide repeats